MNTIPAIKLLIGLAVFYLACENTGIISREIEDNAAEENSIEKEKRNAGQHKNKQHIIKNLSATPCIKPNDTRALKRCPPNNRRRSQTGKNTGSRNGETRVNRRVDMGRGNNKSICKRRNKSTREPNPNKCKHVKDLKNRDTNERRRGQNKLKHRTCAKTRYGKSTGKCRNKTTKKHNNKKRKGKSRPKVICSKRDEKCRYKTTKKHNSKKRKSTNRPQIICSKRDGKCRYKTTKKHNNKKRKSINRPQIICSKRDEKCRYKTTKNTTAKNVRVQIVHKLCTVHFLVRQGHVICNESHTV